MSDMNPRYVAFKSVHPDGKTYEFSAWLQKVKAWAAERDMGVERERGFVAQYYSDPQYRITDHDRFTEACIEYSAAAKEATLSQGGAL
ncbi:hypothetical protein [Ponticaulis profundi]|uniref:Uncharacterized protein n=1 Tax=Ponticaulis profundi TaxID=2665222 RepID=A0ABW1S839_9PROT